MLVALIISIICIIFVLSICIGIAAFFLLTANGAIIASKLVFGLLLSLGLSHYIIVPGSEILNFSVWLIIILGSIFILSLLPRVNYAIKFLATSFVSYVAIEIIGVTFLSFVCAFMGVHFHVTVAYEIFVKLLCTLISIISLILLIKKKPQDRILPTVVNIIQKIIAAVFYGLGLLVLIAYPMNSVWCFSVGTQWAIFLSSTAVALLIDIFVLDRKLK